MNQKNIAAIATIIKRSLKDTRSDEERDVTYWLALDLAKYFATQDPTFHLRHFMRAAGLDTPDVTV